MHREIAARRRAGNTPAPTRDQVLATLDNVAAVLTRVRDSNPRPVDVETAPRRDPWVRWNGYVDAVTAEARKYREDPGKKLPSGAEFSVWSDAPRLMRTFADQNRCPRCGEYVSPPEAKSPKPHVCKTRTADGDGNVDAPASVPAKIDLRELAHPTPNAVEPYQPLPAPGYMHATYTGDGPGPQTVGETPLAGVRVDDLRDLIEESNRRSFLAGFAAAQTLTPDAIPAAATRDALTGQASTPLTGAVTPDKASLRDRLVTRVASVFGLRRCPHCGRFTGSAGHYCPEGDDALAAADGSRPLNAQPVTNPGTPTDGGPDHEHLAEPVSVPVRAARTTAATAGRLTVRMLLNPRGWRVMAPYLSRAAILITPLAFFAGTAWFPLVAVGALVYTARVARWTRRKEPLQRRELLEHYYRPWIWERRAQRREERRENRPPTLREQVRAQYAPPQNPPQAPPPPDQAGEPSVLVGAEQNWPDGSD
jgi:hypothetical protein